MAQGHLDSFYPRSASVFKLIDAAIVNGHLNIFPQDIVDVEIQGHSFVEGRLLADLIVPEAICGDVGFKPGANTKLGPPGRKPLAARA
jgi:hypothetical protein